MPKRYVLWRTMSTAKIPTVEMFYFQTNVFVKLHHHFWREIRTIKVMKCPSNYWIIQETDCNLNPNQKLQTLTLKLQIGGFLISHDEINSTTFLVLFFLFYAYLNTLFTIFVLISYGVFFHGVKEVSKCNTFLHL